MRDFIAKNFRKPEGLFGNLVSRLMERGNMPAYLHLLDIMKLGGGESLFEIGYGPGKGIRHILDTTACTVDGIDFSELMFNRASKKNKQHIADGRCGLLLGDVTADARIGKKYDRVFFVNVIYFWKNLPSAFGNIKKLVGKNGRICFYMMELDDLLSVGFARTDAFCRYTSEDVRATLEKCGFRNVSVEYRMIRGTKGCFFTIQM
jgi:cyclopropane fatty-acyl-phospholipid synthase-like methyltransferase